MVSWLLALHILGITLWAGGLLAATLVLAQSAATESAARTTAAQPARKLMRLLADPGAGLAILAGVWMLLSDASGYFAQRWFQTKLVVVIGLVALHGVVAVLAKRASAGGAFASKQAWVLFFGVLAAVTIIVLLSLPGRLVM